MDPLDPFQKNLTSVLEIGWKYNFVINPNEIATMWLLEYHEHD